jgi:hypothetical protein
MAAAASSMSRMWSSGNSRSVFAVIFCIVLRCGGFVNNKLHIYNILLKKSFYIEKMASYAIIC